jgi:hypothetical protein
LKDYENEAQTKMEIKEIGELHIYTKSSASALVSFDQQLEEEEVLEVVSDRNLTFPKDQIETFLCDSLSLDFESSPYSKKI